MTAIQQVSIVDLQERSEPKPHTVYRIEIKAHIQSWSMWRRYSEFDDLHTDLVQATGTPPPAPLPPKHKFSLFRSRTDSQLLTERRAALEIYLRAIISARDDQWREAYPFKQFLGIPIGKAAAAKNYEYQEIQTRLRDVRADINRREAFSTQGDVNASHKSNVSAKQKLAGVLARIGTLGKGLQELAGRGHERTDMVARLQDDCEKLGKMVTVARMTSSRSGGGGVPTTMSLSPSTDREALLGPAGNTFTRVTRVFGVPSAPQETEETRPLDNHGLLGFQQTQIEQQDQQLSILTTILQRQRHLGEAIGTEIASQNDMLDGLSNDVDRVSSKLVSANRQLGRLG
ncbi:syntaxin [Armillaria novae-zelandiae]|uniref:Syntaxin n=1 Tax=Armillaria novae-zelandiae TaxID=153914 RepID=A0AA39P7S1_9AGAR|nr:syntaxin [Armillaria novae-zelandiae]